MKSPWPAPVLLSLSTLVLAAGCARDSEPVGRVSPPAESDAVSEIAFDPPGGWEAYDANSSMRYASYRVGGEGGPGVDISITPLGEVAGKELAYVNLWRATLGFETPLEEGAEGLFEQATFGGRRFDMFDQTSPEPIIDGERYARIYLASITHGDTRWFFKMAGDAELLTAQIPAFEEMLASVRFGER